MASSIFIWPGVFSSSTSGIAFSTPILAPDGTAALPGIAYASDPSKGFSGDVANTIGVSLGGTKYYSFQQNGLFLLFDTATISLGSSFDAVIARDAANVIALKNGTNAQAFREYGYVSGARSTLMDIKAITTAVSVSGATTGTGNVIPAGAEVVGVTTTTTTTITGASGYTVGDGADADRWGDITGTAVGTASSSTNYTADPRWWTAAARAITLTAKTSNFTGGVVQVTVFVRTTAGA